MRLKCIKLAGFKSFVDPTTVYFPSNLGAVVGPNGCGKSNIIDAVRWVMGESSAKNLRGESMTDVIFNGSGGRKPVGQATIELVFDNSEGKLVGEYASYSEISVRRKVTREGVNQYYLNGTKCRRRDITDLFLGTGLGPRSYAIIEQGMISKLIEARPEELRVFIEEAAGISKYKERRRETENRIRRTHENLERLTDLREELERQLNRLHRQAQAAEKYTELKAEERQKKSWLQALKFQSLNEQFQQQTLKASQMEVQVEALVTGQVSVDTQLETLREDHAEANETFNKVQTRYYALGADLARIEQTIQHSEQRSRQLQVDFDQVQRDLKEAEESQREDAEQLEHWQAELLEVEPEAEMLAMSEEEAAEKQLQADDALQAWQSRWDSFQQRSAEPKRTVEVQKSRIQHLEQVQSRLNQKIERLQQELAALGTDEADVEVEALSEQCAEQEMRNDSLQIEHDTLQEQVQEARKQVPPLRTALDEVSNNVQMQRGRMASLEALQQAAQGQSSDGADDWLASHQLQDAPRIAENLRVATDWQVAAETVLSGCLQALPVQQFDKLAESFAQVSGMAWPLLDAAAASTPSEKNSAVSLPYLSEFIENANPIAPWLSGVYAAVHLPEALMARSQLMDHESIVTQDGLWVGKNWLRVPNDADPQAGILARQQEMETLSAAILESEARYSELQGQLDQAETLVKDGEQSREAMQKQLQEGLKQFNHLNASMNAKKVQWEQVSLRRQHAENDIREAGEQLAVEAEHLAESRAILEVAIEAMETDAETLIELQEERETVRQQADMARQNAQQQKDRFHQLAMRKQQIESQLQALQASQARLQEQVQRLQERREQLSFAISEHQDPSLDLAAEKEALLEKQLGLEEALSTARNRVDSLDNTQRELQQQRSRDDKDLTGLRSQLEQARLQAKELETRLQGLDEQLKAEQWVVEAILAELPEEINVPELQSSIERIGQKISRLGAINLAAIEEYKTEAERKEYLDAQNDDLCEALQTLEEAIAKIDMETRNRFKETFDKVNGGLQELFPKVFGGGNAYLELTGDDMLDTGIAIMARPPGKRNSTIHLLSGGEKALTAIALVFSIFRLNPAPFCMLDEVDAPLDDANVGRYAKMVEEMSESVQFIYITHNKGAMEMAHQLLGVTMHEPGVSRLVSVDVEEAAELAAS